jgi:ATP-dependent DNA ligase
VTDKVMKYGDFKRGMRVTVNLVGPPSNRVSGVVVDKKNAEQELVVKFNASGNSTSVPVGWCEREEVSEFDQIHPMLAKDLDSYKTKSLEDLLDDPDWVMEEKFDGERQILTFNPGLYDGSLEYFHDGKLAFRATTRVVGKNTGRLATNSLTLAHARFNELPVPDEGVTVFDCEILHRDGFQAVRSIMGSSPDKAAKRMDDLGNPYIVIFDVLWFGGRDLRGVSFQQRRKVLDAWRMDAMDLLHERGQTSTLGSQVKVSGIARTREEKVKMMEQVQEKGGEGVMLKRLLGTYTDTTLPGRRSADLLKVKPFKEADVIITGFQKGQGMYNKDQLSTFSFAQYVKDEDLTPDMKKSIVPDVMAHIGGKKYRVAASLIGDTYAGEEGYTLVEMGTTGIKDTEHRLLIEANPEEFIGKVVEVQFQERWPETGRMRHPGMRRMRDDKTALQCMYEP